MLVLTRKAAEQIHIGDDIVITIVEVRGESVRIGIEAPKGLKIQRSEILDAIAAENLRAAQSGSDSEDALRGILTDEPKRVGQEPGSTQG